MFSLARLISALLVLNKASNPSISSALMLSKKSQYYWPRQESELQVNHSIDDTSLLLNLSQDCKTPQLLKPIPQQGLLKPVPQQFLLQPVPQQFLPEPLDTRRNLSGAKHRMPKKAAPDSGLPSAAAGQERVDRNVAAKKTCRFEKCKFFKSPIGNRNRKRHEELCQYNPSNLSCTYCGSTFSRKKYKLTHERKKCSQRPSRKRKAAAGERVDRNVAAKKYCRFEKCKFFNSPLKRNVGHDKKCQYNPLNLTCKYCEKKCGMKRHKLKHERYDCLQRPEQDQQHKPNYAWYCGLPNTNSVRVVKGSDGSTRIQYNSDGSIIHKKCAARGLKKKSYMPHLKKCHPAVWKKRINNALFKPAPAAGTAIAV